MPRSLTVKKETQNSEFIRLRQGQKYRSFVLQKPLLRQTIPVSALRLLAISYRQLLVNYRAFLFIGLIVFLVGAFFLHGVGSTFNLEESLQSSLGQEPSFSRKAQASIDALPYVFINFANRLAETFIWSVCLGVVCSLASCWVLRRLSRLAQVKLRDAFLFGCSQLLPALLLTLFLLVQLLPLFLLINSLVGLRDAGVLTSSWDQIASLSVIVFAMIASAYWLLPGLFAILIISLPRTRPLEAWQTGVDLLQGRRGHVGIYLLLAVFLCLISLSLVALPVLYLIPQLADLVFAVASLITLIFLQAYCFNLYQALIDNKKA